jgi:hypothetical protein
VLVIWSILLLARSAGVAPEQFINYFFSSRLRLMIDLQRFLDFVELIHRFHGMADSTMRAENGVLKKSGYWHFFK